MSCDRKNVDVEFPAVISVLRPPGPKKVVRKMSVCMYVVVRMPKCTHTLTRES